MASVTFEQATRLYPGTARPALDHLDLTVGDGEFVVVVGPSGCGKTTSLRMIAGLEAVDSGRIRIGDRDVTGDDPKDRNVAIFLQSRWPAPAMNGQAWVCLAPRSSSDDSESFNPAYSPAQLSSRGAPVERS